VCSSYLSRQQAQAVATRLALTVKALGTIK
jgi:hypothetical protein